MRYLPHTDEDISAMLEAVGVKSLDDLFPTVPESCRFIKEQTIPGPFTEWELNGHMDLLARKQGVSSGYRRFIGAGSYEHYIPASVSTLLGRSEFVTPYTPYQPEISQGTLQAIYEYQTLVARLLGMEVANASLYDGASALAEALLMAVRITGKRKVAVSSAIHPHYRRVAETYFRPSGIEVVTLPCLENGRTDVTTMDQLQDLAAVAVQSPNFFGCIEDLKGICERCDSNDLLSVISFTEPLAYGLLKNPGSQGAHIVCGEGRSFGLPLWFGGPGLGMFACRTKYMRNMPGRLIGKALDREGKSGFVLTLATREQHIRREKATSNICTNSSHCALAAAIYMATLGGTGMRELATLNRDKSEYLKKELRKAGFRIPFDAPTFNEFVVEFPPGFEQTHKRLLDKGIVAGLPLASFYPAMAGKYLLCVTETVSRNDMDELVREIRS